jgi:chromosome segregation ATPase
MKKNLVVICSLIVAAAVAGAFDIPGAGGGKVDTKKFDELIAAIKEISTDFDNVKIKIDECDSTLAAIAAAHGIADLTSDPAKVAGLKDAVTDEEKAQLQTQVDAIQAVPDDLSALAEKATETMGKIPDALTDLVDQITKNPMAAGSLKDKKSELEEGKATLEQLTTDAPNLVESATNLASTITGLM